MCVVEMLLNVVVLPKSVFNSLGCLKLGMIAVFTPWKQTNMINQGLIYCFADIYCNCKHVNEQ